MTNFNFYKADKAYGELFLQFPKVFLYSEKYKGLSNDAKIAYMVFKDRLEYSIQNNWIDDESNVYFIYTNKELGQLLNCSEHKVIKTKKELEQKNLLLQVQQGFNSKKKRNEPNRLYLADLEVEAYEVYAFKNIINPQEIQSNQGTAKSAVRREVPQSQSNQGTAKNAVRQEVPQSQSNQGTAKNAVNQYKELNKELKDNKESEYDLQNNHLENSLQENKTKETENELIDEYIKTEALIELYGEETINNMKIYSFSDFNTFKLFADKLIYSSKSVSKEREKENDYSTFGNNYIHQVLAKTFNKVILQHKQGRVENLNNYLFVSFKKVFEDYADYKESII